MSWKMDGFDESWHILRCPFTSCWHLHAGQAALPRDKEITPFLSLNERAHLEEAFKSSRVSFLPVRCSEPAPQMERQFPQTSRGEAGSPQARGH